MQGKKDPGKFTVRFNAADPQQRSVIDILNQQGRYKAQFLVNAVLHYIHCSETPNVFAQTSMRQEVIEDVVRSVLAQQQAKLSQETLQKVQETVDMTIGPYRDDSGAGRVLEAADEDAIFKTLNAFRPK